MDLPSEEKLGMVADICHSNIWEAQKGDYKFRPAKVCSDNLSQKKSRNKKAKEKNIAETNKVFHDHTKKIDHFCSYSAKVQNDTFA